jgi:nicotinate-nucleotide--dimethylbenzimidazole phosphoribosyltransferase
MPTPPRSLITPTANPLMERALRDKLLKRTATAGSLGELEPLAMRLGLLQNSLKPQLRDPQLVLVAGDHGLAVDGHTVPSGHSTADHIQRVLTGQTPLSVLTLNQGMNFMVVDAGTADRIAPHDRLLVRKIAHGTRNSRMHAAMSAEQAQAGLRMGMEIAQALEGNAVAVAGFGVGGHVSAALVMSRLTGLPLRDLLHSGPTMDAGELSSLLVMAQNAQARHRQVSDPVDVLAALGGFETAVLCGLMLMAAQHRSLIIVDGMAACAALLVASKIAPAITDYCVFTRSQQNDGLDQALHVFHATALLELGMNSVDGCGAALSWPLVTAAAALLTQVAEGEDPGPTRPGGSSGFVALGHLVGSDAPSPTSNEALLNALKPAPASTTTGSLAEPIDVDVTN